MPRIHLFVYYRVPRRDLAAGRAQAERLQASVGSLAQGRRLMHRPEWREDTQTWMEVYEDVADAHALLAELQQILQTADFAVLSQFPRHHEIFIEPGEPS